MEAFSLLKYWRGGGGGVLPTTTNNTASTTTAVLTAVAENDTESENETDDDSDQDGPFFDLEFTVPDEEAEPDDSEHEAPPQNPNSNHTEEEKQDDEEDENENEEDYEGEREFNFTISPSTNNDRSDTNLSLSPSDDLIFKGKLVQLEPSSFVLNSSEPNSKPQFTASLLKSATKLRVFMLGLKKSKSDKESSDSVSQNPEQQKKRAETTQQRKLFTVKFKVEEVPIMSLFTRDNSSRGGGGVSTNNKASQSRKQSITEDSQSLSSSASSEEKRFAKEVMQKYLKMVKPLYVKVSRRYAEKLRFSGQLNANSSSSGSASAPPPQKQPPARAVAEKEKVQTEGEPREGAGTNVKGQKQGNLPLPEGLRVVCKHLGKSRSASSVVVASAPAPVASAPAPVAFVSSSRRDDSLLQQQDGIQGAILHCKRSFNATRECESSQLPRSVSDPLHEVSPESSRKPTNEGKK